MIRSALVLVNHGGHRGGLGVDLQLCVLCGFLRGFLVGGFWNAPDACVNNGVFRQDEQDTLRVGFGQLWGAQGRIAYRSTTLRSLRALRFCAYACILWKS